MKATITSLIFLLLSLTVSSQTYKYIGIEEGLSNQKIYKIQKDARGYMWFLTHVGIDQYNGKEIKHYKLREGNRELDPLLNINWTFLDKTGTLLVTGKQGRIFVMIQATIVLYRYTICTITGIRTTMLS